MAPFLALILLLLAPPGADADSVPTSQASFPPSLDHYADTHLTRLPEILAHRVRAHPFNATATFLFALAITHTFAARRFRSWASTIEEHHQSRWWNEVRQAELEGRPPPRKTTSIRGRSLHFLGEIEVVFGLWAVPLLALLGWQHGVASAVEYLENRVQYHEPLFVVVIMTLAATRPVVHLAESLLRRVASLGGATPVAWWFVLLTLGPLLGSFVTEAGAMTLTALLLGRHFYRFNPSPRLAYATLGLLFVNISVGGTMTHFAAPPVLMVADRWNWNLPFMALHFGWQSALGILVSTTVVLTLLRRDFAILTDPARPEPAGIEPAETNLRPVPGWITLVHVLAMAWTVLNNHHPVLLVGGFLFFLAFYTVTEDFQSPLELRGPILVGFFLAGLVVHGGLQQWWIAPALGGLGEWPLFLTSGILTAFNDNAALTYLATLVPGLTESMKHAVVAGAVAGGGLTVIANAPNPAGQSILASFFPGGVSALRLFLGALLPTLVVGFCLMLLPH
ncbi:MAG: putative Na+/H+ antiporter [Verrucomicrobiae bacterium]|nr:putative Na+/H+ antiporter [Verrucomicrobiae bacterium]